MQFLVCVCFPIKLAKWAWNNQDVDKCNICQYPILVFELNSLPVMLLRCQQGALQEQVLHVDVVASREAEEWTNRVRMKRREALQPLLGVFFCKFVCLFVFHKCYFISHRYFLHDGLVRLRNVNELLNDCLWSLDRKHWSLSPWKSSSGTKWPLPAWLRAHRLYRLF